MTKQLPLTINATSKHIILFLLLFFGIILKGSAQENEARKRIFYFSSGYMVGKVVPNYLNNFPKTNIQNALHFDVGTLKKDTNSIWAKYYNYPETGVSLFLSNIGNNDIFGNQISILPFISFRVLNKQKTPFQLKLGIGASYFTTYHDTVSNKRNLDIGSPFSWAFQAFVNKTIHSRNGFNLKLGVGYSHSSNGHTQLPNLGLNSALVSLSAQFYKKQNSIYVQPKKNNESFDTDSHYILTVEKGIGFHEFGHKDYPVGGKKYLVHTSSISFGKIFKHHLKAKVGLVYRYYDSYSDYILTHNEPVYIENPKNSSSNFELFAGSEFFLGHIAIDLNLGVNIYKPFYKRFEEIFPERTQLEYNIKRTFSTRLGLNLYLLNTNKLPKHNVYIGPHIKANFDQADFTKIAFGYTYRIN